MKADLQDLPLSIRGLTQSFDDGAGHRLQVLDIPNFDLPSGARIAVRGASGVGKSSLLHILAGLNQPTRGQVIWGGQCITDLPERERDLWRQRFLGFVFQDFHLIEGLSALENVRVSDRFSRFFADRDGTARAAALIEQVGLDPNIRRIDTLSRGERQRLAVARALFGQPRVILADEPTASLDPKVGAEIGTLLVELARAKGTGLIIVTHDPVLSAMLDRQFDLAGGHLVERTP